MALTISSVSPDTYSVHGTLGNIVTITGTGFAIGIDIAFDGIAPWSYDVTSDTELQCAIPPRATNAAATVDVTLTLGAETATLTNGFTYYPFTIDTVSPDRAQYVGGDVLTLTGAGMQGIDTLTIGGIAVDLWRYTASDDFNATVIVPPLATVVDGNIAPVLGLVDIEGSGNAGSVSLNDSLTSYAEGRTLFLDGFDYYRTEDLPLKWANPNNMHIAASGGRRGSGCLVCIGADAEITSPAVARAELSVSGEDVIATQSVTFGVAIMRQAAEPFDIEFRAADEVAVTLRVNAYGALEIIGATSATLSNVLPIGEWVYLACAVTSGTGGPPD